MNMSFDIRYNILIDIMEQMCGNIAGTKKQYSNCYVKYKIASFPLQTFSSTNYF